MTGKMERNTNKKISMKTDIKYHIFLNMQVSVSGEKGKMNHEITIVGIHFYPWYQDEG